MKVGVLTMHRVINYGSLLQAYAMKRVLESYGHTVEFRDFLSGPARHRGQKVAVAPQSLLQKLPSKLASLGRTLEKARFKAALQSVFETAGWPMLGVGRALDTRLQADLMWIGSDEVFNYTQNQSFGYVRCLFGHDIEAGAIVAYAASAGYATVDDAVADGMVEELGNGLRRMAHIGVRDENTRRLAEHCLGAPVDMVIDPTLMHDFGPELPTSLEHRPGYVLVYAYEGRMDAPDEVAAVREFARKRGLRLVSAGGFQQWCDDNVVVTPLELLRLFEQAAFVVTDTFHGSIFAIKHRCPFATLIRSASDWGSNLNKVGFLLQQFGLDDRAAREAGVLAQVLDRPVDYPRVEARLAEWQLRSRAFLDKALRPR